MAPDSSFSGKTDEGKDRQRFILELQKLRETSARQAEVIARYERLYKDGKKPAADVYEEMEIRREPVASLNRQLKEKQEDFEAEREEHEASMEELRLSLEEQSKAEQALRGNEAKVFEAVEVERKRLFDVLENLPAMICLLTPDYRIVFASRSHRERFGEANGRHCYDQCFGRSEPCEACESFIPLMTGKPHRWECTGPDGSIIEAYDLPFTDADGSPLILEMDIDITDRKRAEEALRESEQHLREAQRIAHIGSWEWNLQTGKVLWSPEVYAMHGISEDLIALTPDILISQTHPDDKEKVNAAISRAVSDGTSADLDYRIVRPDGMMRVIHAVGAVTEFDNEGKPLMMVGTNQDITERKRAEEALKGSLASSTILKDVASVVASSLQTRELSERVLAIVKSRLGAEAGTVYLLDDGKSAARAVAHLGYREDAPGPDEIPLDGSTVLGRAMLTGKVQTSDGVNVPEGTADRQRAVKLTNHRLVGLPLLVRGRVMGGVGLALSGARPFRGAEVALLEAISNQMSVGFENARLYEAERNASEALRESEEKYRTIVNTANDGFYWTSPDGVIVDASEALAKLLGYHVDELVGRHWSIVVDSEWMGRAHEQWAGRKAGRPARYDFKLRHKNGSDVWVRVSGMPVMDEQGRFVGNLSAFTDITERKRAEEALRATTLRLEQAHDLLSGIIENTNDLIAAVDTNFCYLAVNEAYHRECQAIYGADVHVGDSMMEMLAPYSEDQKNAIEAFSPAFQGKYVVTTQTYGDPGKSRRIYELHISPIHDSRGRIVGAAHINTEITQRKQAEEERERLLESIDGQRRQLQAVMDAIPAGVVFADTNGKFVQVNGYEKKIWGGNVPLADNWMEYGAFKGWWPDTGKPLTAEEWGMTRALTKGETIMGEIVDIERFDGTRGTKLQCSAPVTDACGNITGAVTIDMDITDRIKLEKDLNAAKQQAELYLDLMGHDINNMHQVALGYLELARDLPSGAEQAGFIEKSMEVLRRSTRLIGNVRKLQRFREGGFQPNDIDVGGLLTAVWSEYGAIPGKTVELKLNTSGACLVRANELLHDVFANLVNNAVKHTGDGTVVTVSMGVVGDDGKKYSRVAVEDNGPGIPDDMKERVFNRMHMGSARGMGLGLYIVRTLVNSYGGKVWVEDRVKGDHTKGARFVVQLPAVES